MCIFLLLQNLSHVVKYEDAIHFNQFFWVYFLYFSETYPINTIIELTKIYFFCHNGIGLLYSTSYNMNTQYYDVCVFGPNGVVVYFG